jgi:hypothetical protein
MKIPKITTSIKPSDFKGKIEGFWSTKWQNSETEASAWWLLQYAIKQNSWEPFDKKEIDAFSKHDFWFNRLTTCGDIVVIDYFKIKIKKVKKPVFIELFYMEDVEGFTYDKLEVSLDKKMVYFTDDFILEVWKQYNKK